MKTKRTKDKKRKKGKTKREKHGKNEIIIITHVFFRIFLCLVLIIIIIIFIFIIVITTWITKGIGFQSFYSVSEFQGLQQLPFPSIPSWCLTNVKHSEKEKSPFCLPERHVNLEEECGLTVDLPVFSRKMLHWVWPPNIHHCDHRWASPSVTGMLSSSKLLKTTFHPKKDMTCPPEQYTEGTKKNTAGPRRQAG